MNTDRSKMRGVPSKKESVWLFIYQPIITSKNKEGEAQLSPKTETLIFDNGLDILGQIDAFKRIRLIAELNKDDELVEYRVTFSDGSMFLEPMKVIGGKGHNEGWG